jgi:hypothetical protein
MLDGQNLCFLLNLLELLIGSSNPIPELFIFDIGSRQFLYELPVMFFTFLEFLFDELEFGRELLILNLCQAEPVLEIPDGAATPIDINCAVILECVEHLHTIAVAAQLKVLDAAGLLLWAQWAQFGGLVECVKLALAAS